VVVTGRIETVLLIMVTMFIGDSSLINRIELEILNLLEWTMECTQVV
jgi:hypothetical protein